MELSGGLHVSAGFNNMGFGDVFRSLFGFQSKDTSPGHNYGFNPGGPADDPVLGLFNQRPPGEDSGPDVFGGIFPGGGSFFFGGRSPPSFFGDPPDGENERPEGFGQDGGPGRPHFGPGSDPMDMFRHFDEMFRGFDEVFRSMGMADFPRMRPAVPPTGAPPAGGGESLSPRDSMLKEPDSFSRHHDNSKVQEQPPEQVPSSSKSGSEESVDRGEPEKQRPPSTPFGWFFSSPQWSTPTMPQDPLDSDLDEEARRGDLMEILQPSTPKSPFPGVRIQEPRAKQMPEGHIKSVRVYTYRSADGKAEERQTVEDGRGGRQTTVTRTIGDLKHSVTTRRGADGEEEVIQNYQNMDENDKPEFDQKWRGYPGLGRRDNGTGQTFDLFRRGFPGFPRNS